MPDFALQSMDWQTVSLLHGEHLRSETVYLEEMARWGLRYGRPWGIIRLEEGGLQVSGSQADYEVALRSCQAITPGGYPVHVDEARSVPPLRGSNDEHTGGTAPIYLGVAAAKEALPVAPAQSQGLLECRALQWRYVLATEPSAPDVDWIQIGRIRRSGTRFENDPAYIPQCVHVTSHPSLVEMIAVIRSVAEEGVQILEKAMPSPAFQGAALSGQRTVLGLFAASLAEAAVATDPWESPFAYLARMAGILRAQMALLFQLESCEGWQKAHDLIALALRGIPSFSDTRGFDWAELLGAVGDALRALVRLYQVLTPLPEPLKPATQADTVVRTVPVRRT